MLEKFEVLFKDKFPTHEKEIKNIPSSCCPNSDILAFSFDEIKIDFSQNLGIPANSFLKSVDAIFFSTKTEELYLIEMKGFAKAGRASLRDCKKFVSRHFNAFNLPNKIIDSLLLFCSIIGYYDINKDCYRFILDQSGIKIKTVLLSNFSNQEILDLTLSSLDKQRISLTKRIDGEIGILNCDTFSRHFKRIA